MKLGVVHDEGYKFRIHLLLSAPITIIGPKPVKVKPLKTGGDQLSGGTGFSLHSAKTGDH